MEGEGEVSESERIAAKFDQFCELWDWDYETTKTQMQMRTAFVIGWIEGRDELIAEAKEKPNE